MKGIVGKKLGMTRVFDAETGVVTPVTVIEAEPCPVVQVKTADAHGYDAVQIAYDKVAERKLTKAEIGHLKKNNVDGAYRHLVELRGPKTHGSHNIRKPGSIGASATPSRVFKGIKMAGRLGGKRVTQLGLVVHEVDTERNLLLVKGAVPGPKNAFVEVREVV